MNILVVEDDPKHMKEAVEVIQAAGHEVIQATDMYRAREYLYDDRPDGVITDLFIPDGAGGVNEDADQPRGLGIVLMAQQEGIPCIICTAGYHHGSKYNWICGLGRRLHWPPMVDQLQDRHNYEVESQSKDWQEALDTLVKIIVAKGY